VGCWADWEETKTSLARPQPQAALMTAGEFGQNMKRTLSALSERCLAASQRSLKKGIAQRKSVEAAVKASGKHYQALLEESLALQKHLRHLAHRILTAQEAERKQISRDLRDEIAQTLLGINVRLLALKKAAKGNRATLKKEIANTQRLVQDSVRSINRFARELDLHGKA
jgi:signal transduction histidine kinase